jgi:hypothetical protein
MQLIISSEGNVRCVYHEAVAVSLLGKATIRRASSVEPDAQARWQADLSRVEGPVLGPFAQRSDAVLAEQRWLVENWLH